MSCIEIGSVYQETYEEFCQRVNETPDPLTKEEKKIVRNFVRRLVNYDKKRAKLYQESLAYIKKKKTDEEEERMLETELKGCGIL